MGLQRRHLLSLAAASSLAACSVTPRFASWRDARVAVQELPLQAMSVQGNVWNLSQVVQHLAQSIEFSIQGFPVLKAVWFRASIGPAAFAVFSARGAMSHSLDEPIPGAPVLDAVVALKPAVQRLLGSMDAFSGWTGEMRPHFAYGALSKPEYERAHLMHLADHWQQFQPTRSVA